MNRRNILKSLFFLPLSAKIGLPKSFVPAKTLGEWSSGNLDKRLVFIQSTDSYIPASHKTYRHEKTRQSKKDRIDFIDIANQCFIEFTFLGENRMFSTRCSRL